MKIVLPAKSEICALKKQREVVATVEPKIPVYKSKTIWAVFVYWFVVKQIPEARVWIDNHGEEWDMIVGTVLIFLRNATAGQIKWKFWKSKEK